MSAHQASSEWGDARAGADDASTNDGVTQERDPVNEEAEVAVDGGDFDLDESVIEAAEESDLPPSEVVGGPTDEDLVTRERDEYLDTLKRLQAEFDNYRKRVTRQQAESIMRATESLLERLLPVLDALDLALAHHESSAQEAGVDRLALTQIAALARDVLSKEGLERIDATGVAFDPNIHDAVTHLEHDDDTGEGGVIVSEVLRAGYQLKGKVVRPAMVQVRG
ncbi:MAG TPA: nucleotide exchange factor GrpE [Acidimicrobiales bacterium]|nr:nucleotide exchange factor GrpE [Acidimicrobiales bacterium]